MADDIIIPKMGMYEDDVLLLEWLVQEGAHVDAGDGLFRMETNKAEVEIETDFEGWVHQLVGPDSSLPIGTRVGVLATTFDEYEQIVGTSQS